MQATPPALVAPVPSEAAALAEAGRVGGLLYLLDRVAWVATDAMASDKAELARLGARGFIVAPDGGAYQTIFFGGDPATPRALFRVPVAWKTMTAGRPRRVADTAEATLSPIEARMVAALATIPKDARICGTLSPNTVLLPPADVAAPVTVYLLTPQQGRTAFPFGGHSRWQVSATGEISGFRTFAKSCLVVDPEQGPPRPAGTKPDGMVVSHLLDPVPTEIHVFTSLAARLPVYVATANGRLWAVQGAQIQPVGTSPK